MTSIIILIAIFLVLFVLILGVIMMAKGSKMNKKWNGRLMFTRIFLQFLAISLIFIIYYIKKKH